MMEAPPLVAELPSAAVAPVEAPALAAPPPAPAPIAAAIAPAPTPAAAPAPPKPLVDETDWRVTRPATRAPVRASDPMARPAAARPVGGDSRSPNLFQRITGAFATPKAPAAAMPVEPSVARPAAPENVVPVAAKPAARPAAAQASINLDVTERAKPPRDDDDLQIPAFLRRQAN
jgi:cell division protein FtsZ